MCVCVCFKVSASARTLHIFQKCVSLSSSQYTRYSSDFKNIYLSFHQYSSWETLLTSAKVNKNFFCLQKLTMKWRWLVNITNV